MMKTLTRRNGFLRFLLPVAAGLVLMLFTGCEDDGGNLADGHDFGLNDPSLYVAMGDSITAAGWPAILAAQLGATVVNHSSGGARSSVGAGAVSGVLNRYKPGFLLILYGANDVINGENPEVTIANLRAMIVSAKVSQTIPVVGTLTPMSASHALYAGGANVLSSRIRSLAAEEGVAVADLEAGFGGDPSLIQGDGLHPTAAGSGRIASIFQSVIR